MEIFGWFSHVVWVIFAHLMFWTIFNDFVTRFITSHLVDGAIRPERGSIADGEVCAGYDPCAPHLDFSGLHDRRLLCDSVGFLE